MPFECDACPAVIQKEIISNFQTRIVVISGKKVTYFEVYRNTIDWNIVRLIWIAYFKNDEKNNNKECHFYKLPKDIINHVIKYLGNVVRRHTKRPCITL